MLSDSFKLHNKTALITGSSQGIGRGIALALAEYGADIILHCRSDRSEAEEVAKEIQRLGVTAYIIEADLSTEDGLNQFFEQTGAIRRDPDILVLNASVQVAKIWTELTTEDFDLQTNTNFKSTFQLIQHFAPKMADKNWGRIVTIGSSQQERPHPSMLIYAATKSAVLNMVKNLAMQLADKGVTVNNLAPGVIGTARIEEEVPEPIERINYRLQTPSGQIGAPEDCAAMAVLLCSAAGRFITGQNIFVDGGVTL